MPNIWQGCVKIHQGCGGVCRWVEAIDRPGVGYTGECCHCGSTDIPTEQMIPLKDYSDRRLLRVGPTEALADIEWDEQADWEENQARLSAIVDEIMRRETGQTSATGETV
ncbi:hypothetical protein [Halorhabdus rudnickae]|uniref:hypothetical protein n=1 Tax=Halorhabdus rudnickae TaxID=1775544 RepID=UPI001AEFCCF0|nr:hypothetical protein [Halorhabdus rudnickae]